MGKYTKEDALRIIISCACKYEQELSGRNLLFIALDKHKRVVTLEVAFGPYHFKHLTGVKTDSTLTATDFY